MKLRQDTADWLIQASIWNYIRLLRKDLKASLHFERNSLILGRVLNVLVVF